MSGKWSDPHGQPIHLVLLDITILQTITMQQAHSETMLEWDKHDHPETHDIPNIPLFQLKCVTSTFYQFFFLYVVERIWDLFFSPWDSLIPLSHGRRELDTILRGSFAFLHVFWMRQHLPFVLDYLFKDVYIANRWGRQRSVLVAGAKGRFIYSPGKWR